MSEGPVAKQIRAKLEAALNPQHLDVINESYMHNVPKGTESHFKVIVVAEVFEGKSLLQRHRMLNEALKEELVELVHALSIESKTPRQWEQNCNVRPSPNCLGGMAKEVAK
uniref:BolAlike protein putative n=1 Tax=Albugo laibachii Nc14 TaxID=890382 RepID=F0W4P3_9STRA|nr:BolAlike protein putative [Albugo laibachii Nc14]|eukprot:CCA16077.1 BolAlike protein putative [Albugo laibachii Nc14]